MPLQKEIIEDFIRQDFEDSITAEIKGSNLIIGEYEVSLAYILGQDYEAYNAQFQDWYSGQWLHDRTQCLENIRSFDDDNPIRFEKLCNAIAQHKIVPFVGAGMSADSGILPWSHFLRRLGKKSGLCEEELEPLIGAGAYEEAATKLRESMDEHLFNEQIENRCHVTLKKIDGAVRFLPYIFGSTVITTNFDNILELIYKAHKKEFTSLLSGAQIQSYIKPTTSDNRCLIKLHGKDNDATTRVLLKEEYERFYIPENTACQQLINIYKSEPLLFLGCSLSNDRTMQLFKEIVIPDNPTFRHYAFLQSPTDDGIRNAKERFLTERNIFPIWYQDEHSLSIESLFVGILEKVVG